MTRYRLTLTPEQARTVIDALDLYMRIGMGNFERIPDVSDPLGNQNDDAIDRAVAALKHALFPGLPRYASRSVTSNLVPHDCRRAYEIQCVARREIARVEQHPGSSVWHNEPMRVTGEPLATCEAVEGEGQ